MMRDAGDKKMQDGEVASRTQARIAQRNGKTRVSPELQELMHMLSSLEDQLDPDESNK